MQQSVAIDQTHRKKLPEIVSYYNKTKVSVNVLNQMARYHITKTATRMAGSNLLQYSGLRLHNAYILYCKVTKTQISRRYFLLALIKEMFKPKVHSVGLSEQTSEASQQQINDASRNRKRCQFLA